jgi:group II intron reverse transcriptase/maturase
MSRSLFLPPEVGANLGRPPRGPLKDVDPRALFSLDALRRAWVKVKAVGGGPGADGVTIAQFEADLEANLAALQKELLSKRYRPRKVTRLLAPKAGQGLRPIALWTLRDKIVQRVVADCIAPYFERDFLDCSYGFRPGRGVADAIQAIIAHREAHRRWVADIDIKDCFDSLDANLLLRFVRQQVKDRTILALIEAWLKAQIFNDLRGPQTQAGVSQGSVISPLLTNIYLHRVDLRLTRAGYHLIRYADDLVICCRRKQEAQEAMQAAAAALSQVKLQLNQRKAGVVHFDQGFQFLGVFFLRNEYFYLQGVGSRE